jgi:Family of unknown function (DUF6000)
VLEARRNVLVQPFYLQMMRLNAVQAGSEMTEMIASVAADVTVTEIVTLLRSDWRPRVMGAWFATAHDAAGIAEAVVDSLGTCFGSLTSPPLVTAALVHAGPTTLEALRAYVERDASNGWGAAGFAVAAIELLGGAVTAAIADDDDHQHLVAMLDIAARIRRD